MNVINNSEETKEYFKQLQIQCIQSKKSKQKTNLLRSMKKFGFSSDEILFFLRVKKGVTNKK